MERLKSLIDRWRADPERRRHLDEAKPWAKRIIRRMKIEQARQAQPIKELWRKKRKASRRGSQLTQEDLDWTMANERRIFEHHIFNTMEFVHRKLRKMINK